MLIHDAAAAFVTLIDTALLWVQTLAAVAAMVGCAAVVCVAPGAEAARRGLDARRSAGHAPQAPESTPTVKRRHTPSWAHSEPYNYDEAA